MLCNNRMVWLFMGIFLLAGSLQAQMIRITTKNNLLLLGVDKNHQLKQVYFGGIAGEGPVNDALLAQADDAYTSYGKAVNETALRITHSDGNLTTALVYVTHAVTQVDANCSLTTITLKDSYYPVEVKLLYKTYNDQDIIEQWMELSHTEKAPVTLYSFASASLSLRASAYYLNYFSGDWANEFNLVETELKDGIKVIDSKVGVRTNQRTYGSFLLSLNSQLQEDDGEVIAGTLAWPGNFQLLFEESPDKKLNVISGMNPYASQYTLAANTVFKTPALLYTYSHHGAGEVSRRFHRWARKYGMADGYGHRSILLNNWEATYFDFDEQKLTNIIKEAGQMGFELFLLDDGWFGNKYPRNDDKQGLGDWEVNHKKLPNGIAYLAEQSRQNNVKFGIWIEPEMVNPKSELYEKHPDWALTAANRELDPQRNQLILDLANPQVQEYVYNSLDKLVTENKGISYLKWDCNRYLSNTGSKYLGKDKQAQIFIDYPRALLQIMDHFHQKHPEITLMVCAGGGGRIDYGSMRYFQEYWPTDNTDALDRIRIQWGLQHFFPAVGMASHVSVTPNHITGRTTPLKFRFDVAMTGKLGMDLQPMQMSADEKEFSRKAIATYKGVRDIVLYGDLYRLLSPCKNNRAALMYVSEDQKRSLVFNYLLKKSVQPDNTPVVLKGLKKDARYKLTEINKLSWSRVDAYEGKIFTGEYLMTAGLQFAMYGEFESNTLLLEEQ